MVVVRLSGNWNFWKITRLKQQTLIHQKHPASVFGKSFFFFVFVRLSVAGSSIVQITLWFYTDIYLPSNILLVLRVRSLYVWRSSRMSQKSIATCYLFQIIFVLQTSQQNLKPGICERLQYESLHNMIYATTIMYLRQVAGFNIDIYI